MTLSTHDVEQLRGKQLVGSDGDTIGRIDEIYLDQQTGKPEWLTVHTGLFGTNVNFVPLAEASIQGDDVRIPWDKATVKDAPNVEPDGQLSQQEEAELYQHYGIDYGEQRSDSGLPEGRHGEPGRGGPGGDVSGPNTDSAMTRSEEELKVGTAKQEASRVRLRKHVVTENVTTTVPVEREELRVEREPITEANAGQALDGPEISEEEHEMVLHEEQPVVEKRTVPKERVRLDKDTVTDEHSVSEDVRKEQIEVDQDH